MLDAVLPTDPTEQHLTRAGSEPAREHLALSVRTCAGTPWARIAFANASHTGRAVALRTTRAEIQNREWSSTPVRMLAFHPSASMTPPTMSICHGSIARD